MTIGIGVLATEKGTSNAKPNHLVLIADTMGSFSDDYSHPRLHKLFDFPESDLYASAAGQIDQAAALMPMINQNISQTPSSQRSFGDIVRGVAQSLFMFKMEKFNLTVLPKYGLPPASIAPNSTIPPSSLIAGMALVPPAVQAELEKEWQAFELGCDLIIGAFDHSGQAVMMCQYSHEPDLRNVTFPGYWAIGSGAPNAIFWLSHRAHVLGMGLKRAAYHAYEAKLMAEGSAHVNDHLDVLVARKGAHWHVSTHKPNQKTDCPIKISQLKKWQRKFGPSETDALDNPRT